MFFWPKLQIRNNNPLNTPTSIHSSSTRVLESNNSDNDFYLATLCVSAVFAVARCLSVRPFVCPSVTFCVVSRRRKISSNFFLDPVYSRIILVF